MWNLDKMLLELFMLMINVYAVEPTLTNWPTNTEVLVGQTVRLNCSSSDPYYVNWEHIPVGGTSKNYVYLGGSMINPYHRRFSIEKVTPNAYNLVISFVELGDSGRYRCIDREGQGEQREAELIVLESPPFCASEEVIGENSCGIKKEETVKLSCDIHYSGNLAPSINCPSLNVTETLKNERKSNQRLASYELRITTQQGTLQSSHVCSTRLSSIQSSPFHFNISSVLNSPKRLNLEQPTNVTCISNSTEQCSHTWFMGDEVIVAYGKTMEIKSPGTYACKANCPIKGISCNVTCVVVVYKPTSDKDPALKDSTLIAIIVILLVIGVGIVVSILFYKKLKLKCFKEIKRQLCLLECGQQLPEDQEVSAKSELMDPLNIDSKNSDAYEPTDVEKISQKCAESLKLDRIQDCSIFKNDLMKANQR